MPRKSKRQIAASVAAKKGWATRRAAERARSRAAKKGWATRKGAKKPTRKIAPKKAKTPPRIDHIIFFDLKGGRGRGKSYGKRDIVVPARRGASFKELKAIAEKTMTGKERDLLQFLKEKNVTKITEGPRTRARKAKLR